MIALLATLSGENPCASMDCGSGIVGFIMAFVLVAAYSLGKAMNEPDEEEKP